MILPNTANSGSAPPFNNTNIWPFPSTSPRIAYVKQLTRPCDPNTVPGRTLSIHHQIHSQSTAGSGHTHHQWPLHSYTGPPPTTPQHLPQRQHEQYILSQQGSLLPHFPNSLHEMAQASRATTIPCTAFATFPRAPMAPPQRPSQTTTVLPLDYSVNSRSTSAHTRSFTMLTTNYNSSGCSAPANTSPVP